MNGSRDQIWHWKWVGHQFICCLLTRQNDTLHAQAPSCFLLALALTVQILRQIRKATDHANLTAIQGNDLHVIYVLSWPQLGDVLLGLNDVADFREVIVGPGNRGSQPWREIILG